MGMSLDHCIHCSFHVWCLICYMIVCCVLCESVYGQRGTLGLENITLEVQEYNELDGSRCRCLLVVSTCTSS